MSQTNIAKQRDIGHVAEEGREIGKSQAIWAL